MDYEQLAERAEDKIFKLRTLATLRRGLEYEPLKLFKRIEGDPKCRGILHNVRKSVKENPGIVDIYNKHIRNSKLFEEQKSELII